MERGITIKLNNESIHTANDLNLIQEKKTLDNPKAQTYLVEVTGRNGKVNLTKGLTGDVCYENRTLEFQYFGTGTRAELIELESKLNKYHGEMITIIDDDTPDFYYVGECSVSHNLAPNYLQSVLSVNADPFRYSNTLSTKAQALSTTNKTITINNDGMRVTPTITTTGATKITKGDITYSLAKGTYTLSDIVLDKGTNSFVVSGSGTITISWRRALL